MTAREAEKLLGGYATGTLTAEERAALFAAALEDQALFDSLADEQALRELLAEPAARSRLLAALAEAGAGPAASVAAWWRRPAWALAAAAAVVVLAVALVRVKAPAPEPTVQMAQVREASPAQEPPAVAPPAEAVEPKRAKPATARKAEPKPAPPVLPPPPALAVEAVPMADQAAALDAVAPSAPKPAVVATRGSAPRMRAMAGYAGEQHVRIDTAETLARTSFAASPQPLLGWTVLAAGESNRVGEAPHAKTVHTGEAFRLEITSAARGWIYVLEPDGAGGWKTAASGAVEPGRPLRFPAAGALRFDEPGLRLWRAAYSPSPLASIPRTPPANALSIDVEVQWK